VFAILPRRVVTLRHLRPKFGRFRNAVPQYQFAQKFRSFVSHFKASFNCCPDSPGGHDYGASQTFLFPIDQVRMIASVTLPT
jgi:hypothetical protein